MSRFLAAHPGLCAAPIAAVVSLIVEEIFAARARELAPLEASCVSLARFAATVAQAGAAVAALDRPEDAADAPVVVPAAQVQGFAFVPAQAGGRPPQIVVAPLPVSLRTLAELRAYVEVLADQARDARQRLQAAERTVLRLRDGISAQLRALRPLLAEVVIGHRAGAGDAAPRDAGDLDAAFSGIEALLHGSF